MAVRFGLYYFSETVGDYLQRVVNAMPLGLVSQAVLITDELPIPDEGQTDAWLIEYNEQAADMEAWLALIREKAEQPFIILYLREATAETLLKALRLGVQECFIQEIPTADFDKTIDRILRTKKDLESKGKTQVLAVLGVKGGLGVTFLALNLAQALVMQKQPTLLLDLDLSPDGLISAVDMKPRYSILDVISNFDRLDPQYLKDILHGLPDGLQVLPGPDRLEDFELIQPYHVEKILQYLRAQQLFRWLVLDLGDSLHEITLKSLEQADPILVVISLTVPGLKAAKKVLEVLEMLHLDEKRLRLVANAYDKKSKVTPEEGEKFLGHKLVATLSFEPEAVWHSLNEGRPLVASQPKQRLAGQIFALAKGLQAEQEEAPSRLGWLTSWLKRRR